MSNDVNSVVVVGRLTQDIGQDERSFGYVANGLAKASVSLAVNRSKKRNDQWISDVSYIDVTIWGKTAENLKPYLTKGKMICVRGFLKQDRWEKNGQKYSRLGVVAEEVQLLGSSNSNSSNHTQSSNTTKDTAPKQQNNENHWQQMMLDDESFPEDIPF